MNPQAPRILVVEDEAIVALDIRTRLALLGYAVAGTAASAAQAIALAEELRPNLVLMDIGLDGDSDGIEAARTVRERLRLPVVFLTAYSEDDTLERAKLVEPFGYILKPFEDRELKTVIEMALYKHRADNEIRRLTRLYAALSQVNQAVVRIPEREPLLVEICRVLVEFGRFKMAWIGQPDSATHIVRPVARHGDAQGFLNEIQVYADDRPEGRGPTGTALRENRPYISNDLANDPQARPWREAAARHGLRAVAAFPLHLRGEIFGNLTVCADERDFFGEKEIALLMETATDITFALNHLDSEARRHRAEEERDRFFNHSVDMLCVAGLDGYFKQVNPAWTRTLGWSAEELLSKPWLELVHPEDREATEAVRASLRDGQVVYAFENRYRCKDGGYRWIEWHSFPLPEEGLLFGVARDVTARKRADRVVARFSELGRELSAATTTEDAGRALFRTAQDLLGWDACFLNLREGETQHTTLVLGVDTIDGRRVELDPATLPRELSPVEQKVLDHGPQLVLRNTPDQRAEEFVPFGDVARRSASLLFVPLRHQGRGIGIVSIQSYQPRAHDAVGLDLLQTLADYTASAFVRLQAESSLRDNEERLRLALAAAGQGLYDLNVQTGVARVSPEYATMLGHDPAEFMETNAAWIERLHPDDRKPVAAAYRAYVRGDSPEYRVEFRQRTKQGDWKWILSLGSVVERDAQGTPLRMLGTHTDITQRKQADAALRESEARFRQIVEIAEEGIWLVDREWRTMFVNPRMEAILGCAPGEMSGRVIVDFMDEEWRAIAGRNMARAQQDVHETHEFKFQRRDGTPIWTLLSSAPILNAAGQFAGALAMVTDITARKQAETDLERSREQLRALSARLERLREEERIHISREIHDELGQLLTGLKMDLRWVETRLERLNELPDINPILDKVVAATELANTIIKAVQRIAAELRPGVLDRLGLATALRYEAARFEERTHIPCRLEETAQDPDVADEVKTALFRIFQESLTNVARHAAAGKVAIRFEKRGTDWLLEVRDDGRGIPPEAVGGVTSLGLLGMRERARLVGGEVTVTRAEPHGTVVTVRVPVGAPATLNRS